MYVQTNKRAVDGNSQSVSSKGPGGAYLLIGGRKGHARCHTTHTHCRASIPRRRAGHDTGRIAPIGSTQHAAARPVHHDLEVPAGINIPLTSKLAVLALRKLILADFSDELSAFG